MKRRRVAAAVLTMLGSAALLLAAFQRPAEPVDATPAVVPGAKAAVTSVASVYVSGPITLSLGEELAWPLPVGWQATTEAVELDRWLGSEGGDALLAAWEGTLPFEDAPVRLTVVRTPRHELSLARYIAAATGGLAEHGFAVTQSAITTTLRTDRLPVAELAFAAGERRGHQVVAFDAEGEHLVLITLAAPEDQFEARLGEFRALIRQATFACAQRPLRAAFPCQF